MNDLIIAICDDEQQFVDNIKQHLNFYSNDKNIDFEIYTFSSGIDLLNSNKKFNIAILDVEMPDIDGIELGKKLREANKQIVLMYITAYKKYLDQALNLNAARFFEKPIDSRRFYDGLDNAIMRIDNTTINFFLKDKSSSVRISADDIIYIEIEQIGHRKTKVVTKDAVYISSNKISFWEEKLVSTMFVKTHKSYIVNLNYVTKHENNCLIMDNNEDYIVPVSRSYQKSFHKNFVRFMAGV